jgi:hypothetical protein
MRGNTEGNEEDWESKVMKSISPIIYSLFWGLVIGVLYFFVLHPLVTGLDKGYIILERPSAILLFTRGIFIILILVIFTTAVTFPRELSDAFRNALIIAIASIVPIPILQSLIKTPERYGEDLFSRLIMVNAATATLFLVVTALFIAIIVCFCLVLWNKLVLKKDW